MKSKPENKIMILAGGTGGHVMPALAVAQHLQRQNVSVHWLGTHHGIEARLVPAAHIPISYIEIEGIRRNGLMKWLSAPVRIFRAILQSIKVFRRERPSCVLSMGGYVAGPGGIAAWVLGIPLVVHEQNAIGGFTNRILSRFAKKVMVAFPKALKHKETVMEVGNPIRKEILEIPPPDIRYTQTDSPLTLLILGGSQGAKTLNETVPKALALLPAEKRPHVYHQTGKHSFAETKKAYETLGIKAHVVEFIDDMQSAYAQADMLIARSGALTISEVAAVGIPSIFIPFPYAVDDHQKYNARYLSDQQGAFLIDQKQLTPENLAQKLLELIDSPLRRIEIAKICRNLAKPEATVLVAEQCLRAGE